MTNPTALVVGGSSGLGRALAELLAEQGFSLALVSRDREDLEVMKASLQTEHGARVSIYPTDLLDVQLNTDSLVQKINQDLGSIDFSYLVAGGSFQGDEGVPSKVAFENSMRLNFESIALFANSILRLEKPSRALLFVSTIAAVAPRSLNLSYSASKKALENYALSLRHYCYQNRTPTRIQVLRMGYMESGFTRGKKLLFPVATPREVASFIFRMKDRDCGIQVYPRFWILILFVIIRLPWAIYKRLRF